MKRQILILYSVLAVALACTDNCLNVTCNADNTLTVSLDYLMKATVLSLEYGTCGKSSRGVTGINQTTEYNWSITLDVDACGMDSTLRTLDYNQTVKIAVGREDPSGDSLVLATFNADTFCSYSNMYTVSFGYDINTDYYNFNDSLTVNAFNFKIKSYDSDYNNTLEPPVRAGKMVYLGLEATSDHFTHSSMLLNGTVGHVFVPTICMLIDESTNKTFTLFNTTIGCENDFIDLAVGYDEDKHRWTIQHRLFLFANYDAANYRMSCDVLICNKAGDWSECEGHIKRCAPSITSNEDPLDNINNTTISNCTTTVCTMVDIGYQTYISAKNSTSYTTCDLVEIKSVHTDGTEHGISMSEFTYTDGRSAESCYQVNCTLGEITTMRVQQTGTSSTCRLNTIFSKYGTGTYKKYLYDAELGQTTPANVPRRYAQTLITNKAAANGPRQCKNIPGHCCAENENCELAEITQVSATADTCSNQTNCEEFCVELTPIDSRATNLPGYMNDPEVEVEFDGGYTVKMQGFVFSEAYNLGHAKLCGQRPINPTRPDIVDVRMRHGALEGYIGPNRFKQFGGDFGGDANSKNHPFWELKNLVMTDGGTPTIYRLGKDFEEYMVFGGIGHKSCNKANVCCNNDLCSLEVIESCTVCMVVDIGWSIYYDENGNHSTTYAECDSVDLKVTHSNGYQHSTAISSLQFVDGRSTEFCYELECSKGDITSVSVQQTSSSHTCQLDSVFVKYENSQYTRYLYDGQSKSAAKSPQRFASFWMTDTAANQGPGDCSARQDHCCGNNAECDLSPLPHTIITGRADLCNNPAECEQFCVTINTQPGNDVSPGGHMHVPQINVNFRGGYEVTFQGFFSTKRDFQGSSSVCDLRPSNLSLSDIESVGIGPGRLEGYNHKNKYVKLGGDYGGTGNNKAHDMWYIKEVVIADDVQSLPYTYHHGKSWFALAKPGSITFDDLCNRAHFCCDEICPLTTPCVGTVSACVMVDIGWSIFRDDHESGNGHPSNYSECSQVAITTTHGNGLTNDIGFTDLSFVNGRSTEVCYDVACDAGAMTTVSVKHSGTGSSCQLSSIYAKHDSERYSKYLYDAQKGQTSPANVPRRYAHFGITNKKASKGPFSCKDLPDSCCAKNKVCELAKVTEVTYNSTECDASSGACSEFCVTITAPEEGDYTISGHMNDPAVIVTFDSNYTARMQGFVFSRKDNLGNATLCGTHSSGATISEVVIEPGPLEGFNHNNKLVTLGEDFGGEANGRGHDYWTLNKVTVDQNGNTKDYKYNSKKSFFRLIASGGRDSMCSKQTVCCGISCPLEEA